MIGEGNADRIADAVDQQCADTDGGFDDPHTAGACFGNAEVQGIIAALIGKTIRLDHGRDVGAFHR